jgi:hypothetical protein
MSVLRFRVRLNVPAPSASFAEPRDLETAQMRDLIIERLSIRPHPEDKAAIPHCFMPNVTMLTKQLSDRRRGHISNRVRRNALISLSLTPR